MDNAETVHKPNIKLYNIKCGIEIEEMESLVRKATNTQYAN
jgi:hypothetical protein